jgi:hypothetical protein
MNVENVTVAAQFLVREYLFRVFGIGSLQCGQQTRDNHEPKTTTDSDTQQLQYSNKQLPQTGTSDNHNKHPATDCQQATAAKKPTT